MLIALLTTPVWKHLLSIYLVSLIYSSVSFILAVTCMYCMYSMCVLSCVPSLCICVLSLCVLSFPCEGFCTERSSTALSQQPVSLPLPSTLLWIRCPDRPPHGRRRTLLHATALPFYSPLSANMHRCPQNLPNEPQWPS